MRIRQRLLSARASSKMAINKSKRCMSNIIKDGCFTITFCSQRLTLT